MARPKAESAGTHEQERAPARLTTTIEIPLEALTITAAPPEMLSQRNVEAVTGIPARVYLEAIRSSGFPLPVVKLGKLRLIDRTAFLSYLRTLAERPVLPALPAAATEPVVSRPRPLSGRERDGVDVVLGELGYRRADAPQSRERRRRAG